MDGGYASNHDLGHIIAGLPWSRHYSWRISLNQRRLRTAKGHSAEIGGTVGARWSYVKKCVAEYRNGGPLDDDFEHIAALLDRRNATLKSSMAALAADFGHAGPKLNADAVFQLAAVDLFVEKAQAVLSARARRMSRAGTLASCSSVAALASLSVYIILHAGSPPAEGPLDRNTLILRIVTAISLGAVVLVAVKYLIALARSFFHESVTLLSRRHALRFGRMYVYLNNGEVDLKELRKAFDWNRGGDSSFLDIKPEEIGKTPWSIVAKSLGDAVEKGVEKGVEKFGDKLDPKQAQKEGGATARS